MCRVYFFPSGWSLCRVEHLGFGGFREQSGGFSSGLIWLRRGWEISLAEVQRCAASVWRIVEDSDRLDGKILALNFWFLYKR